MMERYHLLVIFTPSNSASGSDKLFDRGYEAMFDRGYEAMFLSRKR